MGVSGDRLELGWLSRSKPPITSCVTKDFSLYDILGVLAPGTVVALGVVTLFPETAPILTNKDFTAGEFGVILLASYVAGNLVAGVGNFLEAGYRKCCGGSHTAVALGPKASRVIRPREHEAVETKLKALGFLRGEERLAALPVSERQALGGRIYTYVEARSRTRRIDLFNAQYGMNRGIAAAFVMLVGMVLIQSAWSHWQAIVVLIGCALVAGFRMDRFSRYYSRELVRQFLEAPEKLPEPNNGEHN